MKQCPKCKSKDLILLPWLGLIYECKKCGYKGPVFIKKVKKQRASRHV
jgi:Zn ribbon nucleic-acid-binding protein